MKEPETVRLRHILIKIDNNKKEQEALKKKKNIKLKIDKDKKLLFLICNKKV